MTPCELKANAAQAELRRLQEKALKCAPGSEEMTKALREVGPAVAVFAQAMTAWRAEMDRDHARNLRALQDTLEPLRDMDVLPPFWVQL